MLQPLGFLPIEFEECLAAKRPLAAPAPFPLLVRHPGIEGRGRRLLSRHEAFEVLTCHDTEEHGKVGGSLPNRP